MQANTIKKVDEGFRMMDALERKKDLGSFYEPENQGLLNGLVQTGFKNDRLQQFSGTISVSPPATTAKTVATVRAYQGQTPAVLIRHTDSAGASVGNLEFRRFGPAMSNFTNYTPIATWGYGKSSESIDDCRGSITGLVYRAKELAPRLGELTSGIASNHIHVSDTCDSKEGIVAQAVYPLSIERVHGTLGRNNESETIRNTTSQTLSLAVGTAPTTILLHNMASDSVYGFRVSGVIGFTNNIAAAANMVSQLYITFLDGTNATVTLGTTNISAGVGDYVSISANADYSSPEGKPISAVWYQFSGPAGAFTSRNSPINVEEYGVPSFMRNYEDVTFIFESSGTDPITLFVRQLYVVKDSNDTVQLTGVNSQERKEYDLTGFHRYGMMIPAVSRAPGYFYGFKSPGKRLGGPWIYGGQMAASANIGLEGIVKAIWAILSKMTTADVLNAIHYTAKVAPKLGRYGRKGAEYYFDRLSDPKAASGRELYASDFWDWVSKMIEYGGAGGTIGTALAPGIGSVAGGAIGASIATWDMADKVGNFIDAGVHDLTRGASGLFSASPEMEEELGRSKFPTVSMTALGMKYDSTLPLIVTSKPREGGYRSHLIGSVRIYIDTQLRDQSDSFLRACAKVAKKLDHRELYFTVQGTEENIDGRSWEMSGILALLAPGKTASGLVASSDEKNIKFGRVGFENLKSTHGPVILSRDVPEVLLAEG
uniref:Uncharacterized protein n=1 Tax=viral metagenome TaxID=1070528 RepID=A0A2V0RAU1_9ZZZZ